MDHLSDSANDIGKCPDMHHPDYGWIRVDGELTEAGRRYFQDQRDKTEDRLDNMRDKRGIA